MKQLLLRSGTQVLPNDWAVQTAAISFEMVPFFFEKGRGKMWFLALCLAWKNS